MAGPVLEGKLRSCRYYDVINSGANAIAPYQAVSYLTAAQITSQSATQADAVRNSTNAYTALDRIIGITEHSQLHGKQVAVRAKGISHVMSDGTIAYGGFVGMNGTTGILQKTNAQSPIIDLTEALIPMDQRFTVTYNLSCLGAVTPAHNAIAGSGSTPVPWKSLIFISIRMRPSPILRRLRIS